MMRLLSFARRLAGETAGNAALETAIILPSMMLVLLATIQTSLVGLAMANLHYAVEASARCYAVQQTICPSATAATNYAKGLYLYILGNPTFTPGTSGICGGTPGNTDFTMTGAMSLTINAAVYKWTISKFTASACYPRFVVYTDP
jgi:Flp pilus assembly protein TadG